MNKIELTTQLINSTKATKHKAFIEESKQKLIEYYCVTNKNKLESLDIEKIKAHDFTQEILTGALRLKKQVELKKIVTKLEVHRYAPELNCLHFKSGKTYRLKGGIDTMDEAILYASIHMDEKEIELYKTDLLRHFRS